MLFENMQHKTRTERKLGFWLSGAFEGKTKLCTSLCLGYPEFEVTESHCSVDRSCGLE